MDRYQLEVMINMLQVEKWRLEAYPERCHWSIREKLIKRLSVEIEELRFELNALLMRKAG